MRSRLNCAKIIGLGSGGCWGSLVRPSLIQTRLCWQQQFSSVRRGGASLQQHQQVSHELPTTSFDYFSSVLSHNPTSVITGVEISPNQETVTITFLDSSFTFHAQWLHDAQVDNGPSKDATEVFSQKAPGAGIQRARVINDGAKTTLDVTWVDGSTTRFPAIWLRVFAPFVAQLHGQNPRDALEHSSGWLAGSLTIPEVSYADMFPDSPTSGELSAIKERIFDALLKDSAAGIVKVVGLPAPDLQQERNKENTLVTRVLKQLFGSVFVHPIRGADKTFNVASHPPEGDVQRLVTLPNYNPNKILLPHADHAHYTHPIRIQGLYALEGESENTFVSCPAALSTLKEEAPHLLEPLCTAPMAIGRVAHFYKPSMYQATVDTAITTEPGSPDRIKRFRWHPHLAGYLLSPHDRFAQARLAHRTFQEIMRRDTHLARVVFKPGDMYIWDNFRVLHGRERVMSVPRTSVGQTVPEQVVLDRYRALKMARLRDFIDDNWLVHTPLRQLEEMVELVRG